MKAVKRKLKSAAVVRKAYALSLGALTCLSPKLSTLVRYRVSKGKWLDFQHPRTFDERISWLKIQVYAKSPLVKQCANKLEVREFVASQGAAEILNELYAVYTDPNEISWDELPDSFILKSSNGSGGNVVCSNKRLTDEARLRTALQGARNQTDPSYSAELQYLGTPSAILCERLISSEIGSLPVDYKFYCYQGVPRYVLVCVGRGEGPAELYYYDIEWNRLQGIRRDGREAPSDAHWPMPEGFEQARDYAALLSRSFPFVRVDLYLEKGQTIFGELTFTPCGGINSALTDHGDALLGEELRWLFEPVRAD